MIDTIGGKVVMGSDQKAALDFYLNKLGLQKKKSIWNLVKCAGLKLPQ